MARLSIDSRRRMNSGYDIPVLGFGVYQTPAAECQKIVQTALDNGYRHVDSAVAYRNEEPSAQGIRTFMQSTATSRDQFFFTSKVRPKNINYAGVKADIEETLQKTGLAYIDLYLLHAPYGGKEGRIGAWRALVEGVERGEIRSIGVSNFGVHHLDELDAHIKEIDAKKGKGRGGILSVNQVELHPWLAREDITRWCEERNVVLEAYSPIVRATRGDDPLLAPLIKRYHKTAAQILIRWSLQKGFVPLPKSVRKSRIEENANVFDFELSPEDMESLNTQKYEPCSWDPTTSRD